LAEDNEFLRAIKVHSTTSFGEEVKPSHFVDLQHVKEHYKHEKRQNSAAISSSKFLLPHY
jgi:hypothetical protein